MAPPSSSYRGVRIELERCVECENHSYTTRHDGLKYDKYATSVQRELVDRGHSNVPFTTNPGPQSMGINCMRVKSGGQVWNQFLWVTMEMDPNTRKWWPDTTFRYPRCGAFEIYACKMKKRVEVFSKLKARRWPNPSWLAERIIERVERDLGGWEEAEEETTKKVYTGIGGKKEVTDDELRALIKAKFQTIVSAFRAFDKNGDGMINKHEFVTGMRDAGVDVPPEIMDRLWKMADADGGGTILYQEFASKFATWKASASLHRQSTGTGAPNRPDIRKYATLRESEKISYTVDDSLYGTEEEAKKTRGPTSLAQLAKEPWIVHIPINQCTPDQLRARMLVKHGCLTNAFKHFDLSGDSRISYEEFLRELPKLCYDDNETVSMEKANELWQAIDTDGSGVIDLEEFASEKLVSHTKKGAALLKGMVVDPYAQVAEGHKTISPGSKRHLTGVPDAPHTRKTQPDGKPETASAVSGDPNKITKHKGKDANTKTTTQITKITNIRIKENCKNNFKKQKKTRSKQSSQQKQQTVKKRKSKNENHEIKKHKKQELENKTNGAKHKRKQAKVTKYQNRL
eukprot:gnl/MRDRNA2_/MRDRNA2_20173_c0_seq1.p1 gnl/MRDRNA2_/MRDRNA2_20173_c0~~gnl/MRDRNA2_/MRDRNA2_20173_c0_seq1.p1  ORF type:complete len:594 (+),score=121.56 gnl/MRDRNA2_/MRDRNA2_20173_c0_seq1:72-1784(+)